MNYIARNKVNEVKGQECIQSFRFEISKMCWAIVITIFGVVTCYVAVYENDHT